MLTQPELKIVLETLSKRRAWLRKAVEDPKLEADARTECARTLKLLDTGIQKLVNAHAVKATSLTQAPKPAKRGKITLANARILIAEDNADAQTLLVDILSEIGFKLVDTADDGMQAFDKIKNSKEGYDVVLCDWDMPELSGLEVHQKAKASNTLRHAHFVMVTAVSDSARIKKAIVQGVNDYIVKPVDMGILEGKLKTVLSLSDDEG